jgi:hypothetical protein
MSPMLAQFLNHPRLLWNQGEVLVDAAWSGHAYLLSAPDTHYDGDDQQFQEPVAGMDSRELQGNLLT